MADGESKDSETGRGPAARYRTGRVEAFSDGVLAIVITVLVLELEVPHSEDRPVWPVLLENWPSYLAYVVSFATIGAVWVTHTVITEYLDRVNSLFLRLNLLLLMVVSFLPYPTRLLAEYVGEPGERIVAVIYGGNLLLTSVLLSVLWRYAVHAGLVHPDFADTDVRTLTTHLTPGVASYLVMIGLGLFLPVFAVLGYLLIAIYIMVPVAAIWHRRRGLSAR
ncbi:TMEM175 family protein [Actinophytocola sp.]|uniref:TMEM175 family protein n=1 Tax=Actinophytocola sp. TaxID=1872138 RepID=UPI002D805199|nr:TMEM175 family protein [Actinophytocola sp.]HET9142239.1 TMEM175 family protein [Actinophytocola sp.]